VVNPPVRRHKLSLFDTDTDSDPDPDGTLAHGICAAFSALRRPRVCRKSPVPRIASAWAIQEAASNDMGMGCFYLGGILLVGVVLIPLL